MRERVIGIENEFGFDVEFTAGPVKDLSGDADVPRKVLENRLKRMNEVPGLFLGASSGDRAWLQNGSSVYLDTGDHPEMASAECRSPKDAARWNKAGEEIMKRIFVEPNERSNRVILFKNNVALLEDALSPGKNTWTTYACHENYMVTGLPPSNMEKYGLLVPFLITRQILDGAGWWFNPERDAFSISQRMSFIKQLRGSATTGEAHANQRSIINTRNESHTGSCSGMHRFHVILGDANMLETALLLKLGTTHLVLSMFEDGVLPDIAVLDPVRIAQEIANANEPTGKFIRFVEYFREVQSENSAEESALFIQRRYWEQAKNYLRDTYYPREDMEADAWEIHRLWGDALDALEKNDTEWLVGRIDYVTKKFLADQAIQKLKERSAEFSAAEIRSEIDLGYHELGGEDTIIKRLENECPSKRIFCDEEIRYAISNAPSDTRAHMRGALIRRACQNKGFVITKVSWDYIALGSINPPYTFSFNNPLRTTEPWFEDVLRGKWPSQ